MNFIKHSEVIMRLFSIGVLLGVATFVKARDRVMGTHKPGAIILVVKALARPELKIEIEAIAAKVDG